ncbi:unnamed protein product [Mytilus edulis]|uniref:Uncharacterized protein n=1 Tax=Mytilus edulis TaxID=6550 RepID=A0A8S3T7V1_MYTED|nr:unnamed protein product [Mytilus edulis]
MNRYMQSLQIASETATRLYESLKHEKDITAPNVVIAFVETIPIIGERVKLFTDETSDTIIGEIAKLFTDETLDTSQQLASVKRELHVLSENQDEIIKGIKILHTKIDFLPIKNEITTRSVDINSCFKDFNNFLRQPDSKPRQDDLRKCTDTIKPGLRFIADLLKENKYTKVFEQMIIDTDKYCNISNIMKMHKYLYSLYVTGCEAVITSEAVEYNGSSTNMLEECNGNFMEIDVHLKKIFDRCTKDRCDDIISILNSAILLNIDKHTKIIWRDVISNFPWFNFQVYEFSASPDITIVGNKNRVL